MSRNRMGRRVYAAAITTALGLLASALWPIVPVQAGHRPAGASFSWGANAAGQLGTGDTAGATRAVPTVGDLVGVASLAAGDEHSLAVTRDGHVWAWGGNRSGQLGIGGLPLVTAGRSTPGALAGFGAERRATAVAAGAAHSVALTDSGAVYGWGANTFGQAGGLLLIPVLTPTLVPGLPAGDPVTSIAAGRDHSLALTRSGAVYAWGSNLAGQLGNNGVGIPSAQPVRVTTEGPQQAFVAIAAGAEHSLAVTADGAVYSWGGNASGQLGDGTANPSSVARRVPGLAGIRAVAAGGAHSLAARADGTLAAWGGNADGQLGIGSTSEQRTAQPVPVAGVASIAAGANHSVATLTSGAVATWGDGSSGQLGDGSTADRPTPVAGTFSTGSPIATSAVIAAGRAHTLVAVLPTVRADRTSIAFGTRERGLSSDPEAVVVSNDGPGPLLIDDIALDNDGDFALVPGDGACAAGVAVAAGETCVLRAQYLASRIGLSEATATIHSNAFTGDVVATMSGSGIQPGAALELTVSAPQVPASPAQAPLDLIGVHERAPAIETAGIGIPPLIRNSPIGIPSNVRLSGIGIPPLIRNSPIGIPSNIRLSGIGIPPLIRNSPIVRDALGHITLDRIPLTSPGWAALLSDTTLAARQPHEITLLEVVEQAPAVLDAIRLTDIDDYSAFAALNPVAFVLGRVGVRALEGAALSGGGALNVCAALEAQGFGPCDSSLDESLVHLMLAGFRLDQSPSVPVHAVPLGQIRAGLGDSPLLDSAIQAYDLGLSNLGAFRVADIPADRRAAVLADGTVTTETTRLYDVRSHIRNSAVLRDLGPALDTYTLGELTFGLRDFLHLVTSIPLDQLAQRSGGETAEAVYTVRYAAQQGTIGAPTLTVQLPGPMTFTGAEIRVGGSLVVPEVSGTDDPGTTDVVLTLPGAIAAGSEIVATLRAWTGTRLGRYTSTATLRNASSLAATSGPAALVEVVDNDAGDTDETATSLTPGTLRLLWARPGDIDKLRFTVPAGKRVTVLGDHFAPGLDIDLVLRARNAGPLLQPLSAAGALTDSVPSFGGEALGDVITPGLPVVALSANPRGPEVIDVVSTGEEYILEANAVNDGASADAYSVLLLVTDLADIGPCKVPAALTARAGESMSASTLPSSLATSKNLIVWNRGATRDLHGAAAVADIEAAISRLAGARPDLAIASVPVDGDAGVRAARAARAANLCAPAGANVEAQAIRDAVRARVGAGTIDSITVLGDDYLVPGWRYLSRTGIQRAYVDTLLASGGNSPVTTAFHFGYEVTDDAYGVLRSATTAPGAMPTPDTALARMPLEAVTTFTGAVDAFIRTGGVLDPVSSSTFSADFMLRTGSDVDQLLEQHIGAPQSDRNDDTWGAGDLRAATTAAPATARGRIWSWNFHANHFQGQPPTATSVSDLFSSADIRDGASLERVLALTMGCNTGVAVPNTLLAGAALDPLALLDFPEAVTAKGGILVGQFGFGLGLDNTLPPAFSQELMIETARLLDGSVTVGRAHQLAKSAVAGDDLFLSFVAEKARTQSQLYGLPFWKVKATAPTPPAPPAPHVVSTDPRFGLPVATIHADYDVDDFGTVETTQGRFRTLDGEAFAVDGQPVVPVATFDVTQAGRTAKAAVPIVKTTVTEPGVDPRFAGRRVTGSAAIDAPEPQDPDAAFPAVPVQGITNVSTPTGVRQKLVYVPAKVTATGFNAQRRVVADETLFLSAELNVLYPTDPADVTDPIVDRVDVMVAPATTGVGGFAVFRVRTSPDATGAVANYQDETGRWYSTFLVRTGPGSFSGASPISGDEVFADIHVWDAGANSTSSTQKGYRHRSIETSDLELVAIEVLGEPTPAMNDFFARAEVVATTTAGVLLDVRIDGERDWHPYDGPIVFTTDGVHIVEFRHSDDPDAGVATRVVAVDATPPKVTIRQPLHASTLLIGATALADYECSDGTFGLLIGDSCAGTIADGAALPTSTPGSFVLRVDAVDGAGYQVSHQATWFVGWDFRLIAPLSPTGVVSVNAGSVVVVKFELLDAAGVKQTSLARIPRIEYFRIVSCDTGTPPNTPGETPGNAQLSNHNGTYHYNWQTPDQPGTCQRLVITTDAGTSHSIDFRLT